MYMSCTPSAPGCPSVRLNGSKTRRATPESVAGVQVHDPDHSHTHRRVRETQTDPWTDHGGQTRRRQSRERAGRRRARFPLRRAAPCALHSRHVATLLFYFKNLTCACSCKVGSINGPHSRARRLLAHGYRFASAPARLLMCAGSWIADVDVFHEPWSRDRTSQAVHQRATARVAVVCAHLPKAWPGAR